MDPAAEICRECMEKGLSPEECAAKMYAKCEQQGLPPYDCTNLANTIVQRCRQLESVKPIKSIAILIALGIGGLVLLELLRMYKRR